MSRSDPSRVAVLIPALLLFALACGPKLTREEEVELNRSQYTAELKSLTVKQDPVADSAGPSADEAAAEPAGAGTGSSPSAPAAADGADGAEPDPAMADADQPSVRTDVILDVLVSTTGQHYLPGVTLDVQHVDSNRREKDRRTIWVDTAGLVRGGGIQVTQVLENVDYRTDDGFFVEVRTPIAIEERGGYREFQTE